ncbi:hypothetical protein ELQ87_18295 [Streptomyces griseoviridis]|uniref:Uncharacterized protein n=1 Tax=Streptomyces griseoviridis TaxID=45398 RepID=A0A3S9ZE69_STRGD|nr:hypothetical protein ELQ87_18295 [Streptomyces griseoviridis]QCN87125.1 hypothetical protein DDJ31_20985 [Streptomyces griseoviridis]
MAEGARRVGDPVDRAAVDREAGNVLEHGGPQGPRSEGPGPRAQGPGAGGRGPGPRGAPRAGSGAGSGVEHLPAPPHDGRLHGPREVDPVLGALPDVLALHE